MADDLITTPSDPPPAFRFRFGFAYLGLAAVLGLAVGTGIVLAGRPDQGTGPSWSQWKPAAKDDGSRIEQIAGHVARRYRLDDQRQLLAVIPGVPSIQNGDTQISIRNVVVRAAVTRTQEDFKRFGTERSLQYILCGGGSDCSMAGAGTNARGRLVRREALELALYTFKYVDNVDSVLAFWPPRAGAQATHALFFRKSDFSRQLEHPLQETLADMPALRPTSLSSIERVLVDRLTLPHFFRAEPVQAQDGSAILVLDPVVLGS